MKNIKIFIIAIITFLLFFAGCIVNINSDSTMVLPSEHPGIFKVAAGALIAIYELVVRIIPTVGDYSGISWIIKTLKKISDALNARR